MARPALRGRTGSNARPIRQQNIAGERSDGKRWNHAQTVRFGEILMPEDFGLRRVERAKLGIKEPKKKSKPKPKPLTAEEKLDIMINNAFRKGR